MRHLDIKTLNCIFKEAVSEIVLAVGDLGTKPLDIDFRAPYPTRIRLYIYNLTHPPGGRTVGEHKIQLIVPGQERGQIASFDNFDGRFIFLVGYHSETEVFVLWDAGLYPTFTYSRNIQIKAETVFKAYAGIISVQERNIKKQGKEIVVAANANNLKEAMKMRYELTLNRVLGGYIE